MWTSQSKNKTMSPTRFCILRILKFKPLQDLPESTCTTPLKPSMVAKGFATDHPIVKILQPPQQPRLDSRPPFHHWRHPASPNADKESLAGVATHSRKDFLHVDSCAGICPKIMIGPSAQSEFLFLPHDPIRKHPPPIRLPN
jgi:hypothetical protein